MKLKAVLSTLDGVQEQLKAYYTQNGSQYVLDLEGDLPGFVAEASHNEIKAKLGEFRDNNVTLIKERDKLKSDYDGLGAKFKDVDPEEYKTLKTEKSKLAGKGVKDAEDLEAMITKHINAATKPLLDTVTTLQNKLTAKDNELARQTVDGQITNVAIKAGAHTDAIEDILTRAQKTWKYKDGTAVALDGDTPIYSKVKLTEPLGIDEWVKDLSQSKPHLFKPSKGSGTDPKGASGAGGAGPVPTKMIDGSDMKEFGANLEGIAKGEIGVQIPGSQQ